MDLTPSIPLTPFTQGPPVQGRTPDPRVLRGAPPGRVGLGSEPSLELRSPCTARPQRGGIARPRGENRATQSGAERRCGRISCGSQRERLLAAGRCVPIRTRVGQGKHVPQGLGTWALGAGWPGSAPLPRTWAPGHVGSGRCTETLWASSPSHTVSQTLGLGQVSLTSVGPDFLP